MSRERIARALGRVDYGDRPDDVEWEHRLAQADRLHATGAVVDVDELLFDAQRETWARLSHVLGGIGWEPLLQWIAGEPCMCWAPPGTTVQRLDDALAPHVTVEWGDGRAGWVNWWPPLPPAAEDLDQHSFPTVEALLDWLATP